MYFYLFVDFNLLINIMKVCASDRHSHIPKNSYNKITNRDNSPQDHYKAVTPCFDFFIFLWWDCLKKTEQKICSVQNLYLYI